MARTQFHQKLEAIANRTSENVKDITEELKTLKKKLKDLKEEVKVLKKNSIELTYIKHILIEVRIPGEEQKRILDKCYELATGSPIPESETVQANLQADTETPPHETPES